MIRHVKEISGRFGWLTVLGREGSEIIGSYKKYAMWRCRCDCGNEVVVRGQKLRKGLKKACGVGGHYFHERKTEGATRKYSSEYASWAGMWERCNNSRVRNFKRYGGRGIKVCERWQSFAVFLQDMGVKPSPGLTIERINNDGNYEPENCRWATRDEQRRNMRCSVYVIYEGERMLLLDVVAKLGLSRATVYNRLKLGWALADALSTPVKKYKKKGS